MSPRALGAAVGVLAFLLLLGWYNHRTRRIVRGSRPGELRLIAYLNVDRLSKTESEATGIALHRVWPAWFLGGVASGLLSITQDGFTFRPGRLARLCGVHRYSRTWRSVHHVSASRNPVRSVRAMVRVFVTESAAVVFEVEPAGEAATALRSVPVVARLDRL